MSYPERHNTSLGSPYIEEGALPVACSAQLHEAYVDRSGDPLPDLTHSENRIMRRGTGTGGKRACTAGGVL